MGRRAGLPPLIFVSTPGAAGNLERLFCHPFTTGAFMDVVAIGASLEPRFVFLATAVADLCISLAHVVSAEQAVLYL